MNVEEKYVLTLTRKQAYMVQDACELFARLKIGQFNRITEHLLDLGLNDYCERRDNANDLLRIVSCIIFGRNIYGSPELKQDETHYRAWDIYTVLRHAMWEHDNPDPKRRDGWCVFADTPYTHTSEPLPECKVLAGKERAEG